MHAHEKPLWHKGTAVWRTLLCLTVVSFLCRAAVPVGYMPDFSGGRDGGFTIVLCTAGGGTSTLQLDLGDESGHPTSGDQADSHGCPYGLVVSQAVVPSPEAPVLVGAVSLHPVPVQHGNRALPPLPALGPPLGSRAPPSNLG